MTSEQNIRYERPEVPHGSPPERQSCHKGLNEPHCHDAIMMAPGMHATGFDWIFAGQTKQKEADDHYS
jgi:hypothetical protein